MKKVMKDNKNNVKSSLKLVFLLAIIQIFSVCVFAEEFAYSWYFKPAKEMGAKPEIMPEVSSFIDEYNVIAIGKGEEKEIYLTFDAGYENGNVKKILDTLNEKGVKGAFFILPQLAKTNPELVREMKDTGHLVCNHTRTHKNMSRVTDIEAFEKELKDAENLIYEYSGVELDKFYRPPEGAFSRKNLEFADSLGYTTVFWSLAYADWDNNNQLSEEKALQLITKRTHSGCVALLHPTSSTNALILGKYIDKMKSEGYTFKTLYEFETEVNENEAS